MKAATMEELTRGKKQAFRLLSLLKDLLSSPENQLAAELLVDVVGCFTRALSYLELEREETTDQPPRPVPDADFRPCSDERRSDLGRRERKLHTPRKINCQTRAYPYSCRTILSTTIEDGHIWRKYGQKDIYGTKHSRSYYRCIHKHDRGCRVTRHVQKTEEDDSVFAITYIGEHTCIHKSRDEEVISNHSTGSSSTLQRPLFTDLAPLTTEGSSPASLMADSVSRHGGSLGMEFDSGVFKLDDWLAPTEDE
ncbi:probable WRKY transcription factor 70 [Zingiber officinale]|uniref:probable WRKY transcription factor 70 n=1 Tax=Zingiber officinale TaxID=94328 RepID=UPI001C4D391E|nr:probable WRKY transcription factor 70 [Zingiber officinale]